MAIINRSTRLYGDASNPDASFAAVLELHADFAAEVYDPNANASFEGALELTSDFQAIAYNPYVDASFDGDLILSAEFLSEAVTPGDGDFQSNLILTADFECDTALELVEPQPLLTELAATAFANQNYASGGGRLFINNVPVPFVSAEISASSGAMGETLAIELARADLDQLPANATFKFEIGQIIDGLPVWETIADGAKLASRNYRMSTGRDALSIVIKSADSKLDRCPVNNLIVYDRAKAEVSAEEIEPLFTNTGEVILTTARPVNVLTLKKLLDIAFVEGCGFSSVSTDIPNYEIARCDFSITNSFASAVAQFVGMYEPDYVVEDNNLLIQKTINPHPAGYTPNPLHASRYPNFTEAADNALSSIDGYVLQYTAAAGSRHADRNLPTVTEPVSGKFGDADFVETTIQRKMRDWFETGNPVAVRSELKKETRETRRGGILIGRETKENKFDRLGRGTGYTNTSEARMPDLAQNNAPSLLKTREETQTIHYKTNPFAPRQTVSSKVQTSYSALLAIDSENTALDLNGEDSPYGQDYEKVFEAGNLQSGMTSEFRTLETVTDYFRPQANGQIEVRTERYDALRGKMKPSLPSETKSGDISVLNFQKQQSKVIFKAGVTQGTRSGELKTLNAGELPYQFAEQLTVWLLANPPVTGSIEIVGYDKSLKRGVSFNLRGRGNANLGNFKARGYVASITPQSIATRVEALKV